MATGLKDALKLVREFKSATISAKVCPKQCNLLAEALGLVADFLEEVQNVNSLLSSSNIKAPVWQELSAIVCRALQLIRSCEDDGWEITTLLREDGREDFKDVHAELYDCIELVSVFLFHSSADSKVSEAFAVCLLKRSMVETLEAAAVNDRRQLARMVFEAGQSGQEAGLMDLLSSMLLERAAPRIEHGLLQIKQHIGQGGFGTVYEATWLDHLFAVKVFDSSDVSFSREIAALATNKHPNILQIAGYSVDTSRQHHLVMERMDMDLAGFLKKKRLAILTSVSILLQVAKGMEWLHSRNVIHRDLKPQNVLVAGDDDFEPLRVKIADFGVAKTGFVTNMVSATRGQGTPAFMAPEVWSSNSYSKMSDVFSYAMICYQVLTGREPFERDSYNDDLMERVCEGLRPPDTFPTSCPVELSELTRLCWRAEPEERPQFSEICYKLKLLKAKLVTGIPQYDAARRNLMNTQETRHSQANGSSTGTPPSSSHTSEPRQRNIPRPTSNRKAELLAMMQKGQILEALNKVLPLNDHSLVWWLCSQLDASLLLSFDKNMVLAVAEQINNDLGVDTVPKELWLKTAVQLLTADYNAWKAPRVCRFFQAWSRNLNCVLAITPRNSEMAEFVLSELQYANMWLQRAQNAAQTAATLRSFGLNY